MKLPMPDSFFARSQASANAAGTMLGNMATYEQNLANNALRQEEMAQRLELENRRMDIAERQHRDQLSAAEPSTGDRIGRGVSMGAAGYGLGSAAGGALANWRGQGASGVTSWSGYGGLIGGAVGVASAFF